MVILIEHLSAIDQMATLAGNMTLAVADYRDLRMQLVVHAAGGLLALFAATLLSVYKPWGMTPYGRRNTSKNRPDAPFKGATSAIARSRAPRWAYVVGFHVVGLLVLFLIAHLTGLHQPMSH
jgi:hypothetical protein